LVVGHPVAGVIVREQVDLQYFAQELAPGVDRPEVFRVRVRVQYRYPLLWVRVLDLVCRQAPAGLDAALPPVRDVETGNLPPPPGLQPDDFVLLELRRRRRLEQQRANGIPHIAILYLCLRVAMSGFRPSLVWVLCASANSSFSVSRGGLFQAA